MCSPETIRESVRAYGWENIAAQIEKAGEQEILRYKSETLSIPSASQRKKVTMSTPFKAPKASPVYALIIAPHPDDVDFGIAGTVARWTSEGKKVAYVICTSAIRAPMTRHETGSIDKNQGKRAESRCQNRRCDGSCLSPLSRQGIEDTTGFRKSWCGR